MSLFQSTLVLFPDNVARMADLSFAYDSGMQDGKGDNQYMDFTHKYFPLFLCSPHRAPFLTGREDEASSRLAPGSLPPKEMCC